MNPHPSSRPLSAFALLVMALSWPLASWAQPELPAAPGRDVAAGLAKAAPSSAPHVAAKAQAGLASSPGDNALDRFLSDMPPAAPSGQPSGQTASTNTPASAAFQAMSADPAAATVPAPLGQPSGTSANGPAGIASSLSPQDEAILLQAAAEAEAARAAAEPPLTADMPDQQGRYRGQSFLRARDNFLPLSPDQIREFMRRNEDSQRNAIPPVTGTPKPAVNVENISLEPGVEPPVVSVAAGYVTTITLLDASGQPWPISDVGVGGNFEVSPTSAGTHVVRVTPLTRFGNGNLSVLLKDLTTPIIFRLAAGTDKVHLRYDARIPRLGPEAKVPLIDKISLVAGDEIIMAFLDNVPPGGSKRIKVSGVDYRTLGWQLDGQLFVRTPHKLLSPGWDQAVSSSDGTTVYQLNDMAPVLLLSDNGILTRARIQQDLTDDTESQRP